jgi:hypothetical protein
MAAFMFTPPSKNHTLNIHEGAAYSRIRLIPLQNITNTQCNQWHFQK